LGVGGGECEYECGRGCMGVGVGVSVWECV